MGLTVHYDLRLSGINNQQVGVVRGKMEALRQKCLDLPFREVDDRLFEAEGKKACDWQRQKDEKIRWMLLQARESLVMRRNRKGRWVKCQWGDGGAHGFDILPEHVIGFSAWPGEGCESTEIVIGRLPPVFEFHGQTIPLKTPDWRAKCFCKTQYASNPDCGGIENFLKCHLTLIAMLDAAKRLGFGVEVSDEGEYWETRDVETLARNVGAYNVFIAGMAGILKDTMKDSGVEMVSAMDGRRDFERLEHEARKEGGILEKLFRQTRRKEKPCGSFR